MCVTIRSIQSARVQIGLNFRKSSLFSLISALVRWGVKCVGLPWRHDIPAVTLKPDLQWRCGQITLLTSWNKSWIVSLLLSSPTYAVHGKLYQICIVWFVSRYPVNSCRFHYLLFKLRRLASPDVASQIITHSAVNLSVNELISAFT